MPGSFPLIEVQWSFLKGTFGTASTSHFHNEWVETSADARLLANVVTPLPRGRRDGDGKELGRGCITKLLKSSNSTSSLWMLKSFGKKMQLWPSKISARGPRSFHVLSQHEIEKKNIDFALYSKERVVGVVVFQNFILRAIIFGPWQSGLYTQPWL